MQLNAGGLNNQCQNCWDNLGRTQTDQNGVYSLGPLPPFNLFVEACPACSGLLYYNQYYSGSLPIETAHIFNLLPGQTVGGVDFTMRRGRSSPAPSAFPPDPTPPTLPRVGGYSPGGIQIDVWPNGPFTHYVGMQTDSQGNYQVSVPRSWTSSGPLPPGLTAPTSAHSGPTILTFPKNIIGIST
ncbi:MAG: hypothetical protein IPN59_12660 [Holophaga sp.]|nr:hypothetical protein [Holophaga sp.]